MKIGNKPFESFFKDNPIKQQQKAKEEKTMNKPQPPDKIDSGGKAIAKEGKLNG